MSHNNHSVSGLILYNYTDKPCHNKHEDIGMQSYGGLTEGPRLRNANCHALLVIYREATVLTPQLAISTTLVFSSRPIPAGKVFVWPRSSQRRRAPLT